MFKNADRKEIIKLLSETVSPSGGRGNEMSFESWKKGIRERFDMYMDFLPIIAIAYGICVFIVSMFDFGEIETLFTSVFVLFGGLIIIVLPLAYIISFIWQVILGNEPQK